MRRKDREITDLAQIEEIIANARYMHLGMFDDDYPYVVPVNYGYILNDKLIFYIHCAKEGHKLECIKKNNKVFVQIDKDEKLIPADIPCKYSTGYKSIMCRGEAIIIKDIKEKCLALSIIMKTQTKQEHYISDEMAEKVCVIKIIVDSYTAKAHL